MPTSPHYRRWLTLAPAGLATIGLGVCLVSEAATKKRTGQNWFWPGTLALVVLNTGVSLVGGAVREEVLYRLEEKADVPYGQSITAGENADRAAPGSPP